MNYVDYSGNISIPDWIYYSLRRDIWLAANAFLTAKGYTVSKMMFKEALYGDRKLSSSQNNQIINKLKTYNDLNKYIINYVKSLRSNIGSFGSSFNYEFRKTDLYYAIHWSKCFMTGSKKNNVWTVTVNVSDTFDFTEWWSFKNHGAFATLANNLGVVLQQVGALKAFKWSVKYTIKIDVKKGAII